MEWMLNVADVQQQIRYVFVPKPRQQRKTEMNDFNLHAAAVATSGSNRADHGDEQSFLTDVVMKIAALSDDDWNGMHSDLQTWYNNACEAMTAEKPIAGLGPSGEAPARRRPAPRGGAHTKTAAAPTGGESAINTDAITVGMSVRLKTARMDVSGDVAEVTKNVVKVKQADGTEKAVALRRIKEAFSVGGGAPAPAAPAPKGADTAKPAAGSLSLDQVTEGMHIVARTARKEVSGIVVSIGKTALVIKEDGEDKEQRVAMRRITEVEAVGGAAAPAGPADSGVDEDTLTAVRQAIVDDLEADADEVHATLRDEDGVDVPPHVVAAVHADTHAIIGMLSQAGLMAEDE